MNDVLGVVLYAAVSLAVIGIVILDQSYRIFPRDPKRKPVDVSERQTVRMLRVREPVAR